MNKEHDMEEEDRNYSKEDQLWVLVLVTSVWSQSGFCFLSRICDSMFFCGAGHSSDQKFHLALLEKALVNSDFLLVLVFHKEWDRVNGKVMPLSFRQVWEVGKMYFPEISFSALDFVPSLCFSLLTEVELFPCKMEPLCCVTVHSPWGGVDVALRDMVYWWTWQRWVSSHTQRS